MLSKVCVVISVWTANQSGAECQSSMVRFQVTRFTGVSSVAWKVWSVLKQEEEDKDFRRAKRRVSFALRNNTIDKVELL